MESKIKVTSAYVHSTRPESHLKSLKYNNSILEMICLRRRGECQRGIRLDQPKYLMVASNVKLNISHVLCL